jgi:prepilin-type N-terminal cleavage/methylation domain-containing protein
VPGTFSQYQQGEPDVIDQKSINGVGASPGGEGCESEVSCASVRHLNPRDQFSTYVASGYIETAPPGESFYRREGGARIERGFTLIEILIVIVVLGILAAVVIFALGGISGKTAVAACQADGATVASAISVFNNENAGTTVTIGDLTTGSAAGLGGPYVSSWPSNGTHYAFGISAGTLIVQAPWPTASAATTPSSTGANISSGIAYTGPTSCTGVQ